MAGVCPELGSLHVAAEAAVIGSELASDDSPGDRRGEARPPSQIALGRKSYAGTFPGRLQAPRAVDQLWALDYVNAKPARPRELRELGDLFELPHAGRLRTLAKPAARSGRAVAQRLDRSVRGLPIGEVRGVREV